MTEKKITIGVENLHCADCLATLSQVVLPTMKGIKECRVEAKQILVTLDEEELTEEQLLKHLAEYGFIQR